MYFQVILKMTFMWKQEGNLFILISQLPHYKNASWNSAVLDVIRGHSVSESWSICPLLPIPPPGSKDNTLPPSPTNVHLI